MVEQCLCDEGFCTGSAACAILCGLTVWTCARTSPRACQVDGGGDPAAGAAWQYQAAELDPSSSGAGPSAPTSHLGWEAACPVGRAWRRRRWVRRRRRRAEVRRAPDRHTWASEEAEAGCQEGMSLATGVTGYGAAVCAWLASQGTYAGHACWQMTARVLRTPRRALLADAQAE